MFISWGGGALCGHKMSSTFAEIMPSFQTFFLLSLRLYLPISSPCCTMSSSNAGTTPSEGIKAGAELNM